MRKDVKLLRLYKTFQWGFVARRLFQSKSFWPLGEEFSCQFVLLTIASMGNVFSLTSKLTYQVLKTHPDKNCLFCVFRSFLVCGIFSWWRTYNKKCNLKSAFPSISLIQFAVLHDWAVSHPIGWVWFWICGQNLLLAGLHNLGQFGIGSAVFSPL